MINKQALALFVFALVALSILGFVLKVPAAVLALVAAITLLAQAIAPSISNRTQRNSDRPPPPDKT